MPLSYIGRIIRMYVNAKAELVALAPGLRPERRWLGDYILVESVFFDKSWAVYIYIYIYIYVRIEREVRQSISYLLYGTHLER